MQQVSNVHTKRTILNRQYSEMMPGHCDSCGEAGRLVPIEEGFFCGPAALCHDCYQRYQPCLYNFSRPTPNPIKETAVTETNATQSGLAIRFDRQAPTTITNMPQFDTIQPVEFARQLAERIQQPDPFPEEEDEGLPCDSCGFQLRPHLDYAVITAGSRICTDCFERQFGLERFELDADWLAAHPKFDRWHIEQVENIISSEGDENHEYATI